MNDLRDWLKDGDPVVNEPPLSDADVQQMRRAIVTAGESRESSFSDWARGSWAAATVVIAQTLEQMARGSPLVVRATVGQVQSTWSADERTIQTWAEVQLTEEAARSWV